MKPDRAPVVRRSSPATSDRICIDAEFFHPRLPGPVLLAVTSDRRLGGSVAYASAACSVELAYRAGHTTVRITSRER